jgi:hypothetical protein
MKLAFQEDKVGVLVAVFVAILPLLPGAARYLGADAAPYFDAVFLAAVVLWAGAWASARLLGSKAPERRDEGATYRVEPSCWRDEHGGGLSAPPRRLPWIAA